MDKGSKQKMKINAMATDSLSRRRLVLPIRLGIEPMERLLVASFKMKQLFQMLLTSIIGGKRVPRHLYKEEIS
ncbi:MAG: hypothetical protein FIB07_14285 [Candidatus Methanoperedens sp.]|nr:hypothetical protein [Candidatus Methanoperedens sp.]